MTLPDAIAQANTEPNRFERARRMNVIMSFLRFKLGMNYRDSQLTFEAHGVPADRFEELCLEVDNDAYT